MRVLILAAAFAAGICFTSVSGDAAVTRPQTGDTINTSKHPRTLPKRQHSANLDHMPIVDKEKHNIDHMPMAGKKRLPRPESK